MFRRLVLSLLVMTIATPALAREIKPPTRTPVPTTEHHMEILRSGVALHDEGNLEGAIKRYESVLAENPDDVTALYELAYSLFEAKRYEKSLETAYRGAEYKSDALPRFYLLIGNNLDDMGRPNDAIKVYKEGIKILPTESLLHFNLAVTYLNQRRVDDARRSLKNAVALRPDHPSAHFLLAMVYFEGGYRVPALLAGVRFLALEPDSQRTANMLDLVSEILRGGVEKGAKENEISINFNVNGKTDEGDFTAAELMLGLSRAASEATSKEKSEAERLVAEVDSLVGVLAETSGKKGKKAFVSDFYLPFFVELKKRGYVEPFVYHAFQGSNLPGVDKWLVLNSTRVREYLAWSEGYTWPPVEVR
jgi:Flp pilus assembly protein TadD